VKSLSISVYSLVIMSALSFVPTTSYAELKLGVVNLLASDFEVIRKIRYGSEYKDKHFLKLGFDVSEYVSTKVKDWYSNSNDGVSFIDINNNQFNSLNTLDEKDYNPEEICKSLLKNVTDKSLSAVVLIYPVTGNVVYGMSGRYLQVYKIETSQMGAYFSAGATQFYANYHLLECGVQNKYDIKVSKVKTNINIKRQHALTKSELAYIYDFIDTEYARSENQSTISAIVPIKNELAIANRENILDKFKSNLEALKISNKFASVEYLENLLSENRFSYDDVLRGGINVEQFSTYVKELLYESLRFAVENLSSIDDEDES